MSHPKTTRPAFFALALLTFMAGVAPAQASSKTPVPEVTYQLAAKDVKGDSAVVRVLAVIPKGWHIQSDKPLDEFLIPTELKAEGAGLRFGKPVFPKPHLKEFPALGGRVALFEDTVAVTLVARAAKGKLDAKGFATALEKSAITLRYQACNDSQCLPPKTVAARFVR